MFEGEWKAGEAEGRGTERCADGSVFEGEWKAGGREGRGTVRYPSGNVFEGEFKANEQEGRGTTRLASGEAGVGTYRANTLVGVGVVWTADRQTAWRLLDCQAQPEISLGDARALAAEIGLPVPPPHHAQYLVARIE